MIINIIVGIVCFIFGGVAGIFTLALCFASKGPKHRNDGLDVDDYVDYIDELNYRNKDEK